MSSWTVINLFRQLSSGVNIATKQQLKNLPTKFISTSTSLQGVASRLEAVEPSRWRRFLKMDFFGFRRHQNKEIAYRLYLCCSDAIDHKKFFSYFKLEDTFNSLFLITELHVWMMSARLMQENKLGVQFRHDLVEAMWKDIDRKSKVLGPSVASTRKEQLEVLCEQMQASFFAYDEGLLTTDIVLASALWRRFLNRESDNVHHLETLVSYVRRSMQCLDSLEHDNLLSTGKMKWPELKDKSFV